MTVEKMRPGSAIEAYWPDDDTWIPATLKKVNKDGSLAIVWEDGSESGELPADYARKPGSGTKEAAAEQVVAEEEVPAEDYPVEQEPVAAAPSDDTDMDALMAAALAAGACDEADGYVEGNLPPSAQQWGGIDFDKITNIVDQGDAPGEAKKRCRPPGLMTTAQAIEAQKAAAAEKKAKKA
eukprot:TRINITY_DN70209_c0_g1_i1.p1 TRINITY_DN70209_c0_g1~~TRINITY_DN70209_c0_g1_i1.p1  ORF type:complete len:181 (-),score=54.18 TRINITY_DN70209_c0_g1_i1:220-762(-)